jgi:DUF971 family protein
MSAKTHIPEYNSSQAAEPPSGIVVHSQSQVLELSYGSASHRLPFEFLRVYSPSAEVVGHGPGQEVLQVGKRGVTITGLEPVGLYAVKPTFSDGHTSGIFSWGYLRWLADHQEALWQDYLGRLQAAGASRDPDPNAPPTPPASGCASHGKSAGAQQKTAPASGNGKTFTAKIESI